MDKLRFNDKGYYDPTAYEALKKITVEEREARRKENYRPMVYICSPFSGDIEGNTKKARTYCRFAVVKRTIPIAPHLLFPQFMSEEHERNLALFMGIVLLSKCDEVWVFGDRISEGMSKEIEKAKIWRKKIRRFTEEMEELG